MCRLGFVLQLIRHDLAALGGGENLALHFLANLQLKFIIIIQVPQSNEYTGKYQLNQMLVIPTQRGKY